MLAHKSFVASRASLPSRLFVAVAVAAGAVAVAGLAAGPAAAQIDPLRTPLTQTTTGVFQYPGGSWGWERVQVGEIYVEQTGIAGAVQHWVLFRDYSPALPFELAASGSRYADLADFLATTRDRGATHVPVAAELRRCEPTTTCVTLTRGRDGRVADALIRRDEPDRNFGGSGSLSVTEGASVRRALLRFDTSRIPAGAVVVSADLALHGLLYGAATSVTPVLAPWDEATVTWASFVRAGEALGAGPAGPYLDRTTAVVPLPTKGSTTRSPGADEARMNFSISASGFWVAWAVFSAMPLHKTGSSKTSRGLAPPGCGCHLSRRTPRPYCDDTACTRSG